MQNPQKLIRVLQVSEPRIPRTLRDAVADPANYEPDDDGAPGKVARKERVSDEPAERGEESGAAAAEGMVESIVSEGGEGVAEESTEEDQGDNGVGDAVIGLKLRFVRRVCAERIGGSRRRG